MAILAIRHWYYALCGLVFMSVFTQHPDMPRGMFGIQGLNPWNALLLIVLFFWIANRRLELPVAPSSPFLVLLFIMYTNLIIASSLIAMTDVELLSKSAGGLNSKTEILVDGIINPLKYLLVGIMFYDGTRTRHRIKLALFTSIISSMCYGLLMFKTMKLKVFTINYSDARRLTDKLIGLHANDMAELLGITIWSALFIYLLINKKWQRILWITLIALIVPPFVSLKSRAGFLAFCCIGMALGVVRWRKIFIFLPVAIAIAIIISPSIINRVMTGVGGEMHIELNWDEITASRITNLWPPVIKQICKSPIFGHGRYAILREACYKEILDKEGEVPSHPHNAYLEILLDTGIVGLTICLSSIVGFLHVSMSLIRMRGDTLVMVIGAIGLIAITGFMSAGIAGSSFYLTQSKVAYIGVWGIALRLYREHTVQLGQLYRRTTFSNRGLYTNQAAALERS